MNYTFSPTKFDNLLSEVRRVVDFFCSDVCDSLEPLTLDFGNINFVHPVFVTPIVSFIEDERFKGRDVQVVNINSSISGYLNNIYFNQGGLKTDKYNLDDLGMILNGYHGKNYLPIVDINISDKSNGNVIDNVLNIVFSILKNNFQVSPNVYNAISYITSELTDNVVEHSSSDRFWIFVQYYPGMDTVEICIKDNGITLRGSYIKSKLRDESITDVNSLELALNGLSTKSKERGFGIHTSKNIAIDGFKGSFIIISGGALLYNSDIVPINGRVNGTFITIKLKRDKPDFNIYNYINN